MLVGIGLSARSFSASMARRCVLGPRIASHVASVAPSTLTWIATSPVLERRLTRARSRSVPFVEMHVMIRRSWHASRMVSKSGRMNGSPPPMFTWKTFAWWS